jgi:serine phosphatase RsbU (regulator of sigma subunit)
MNVERASLFFKGEDKGDLTCVACKGLPDDLLGSSVPVEKSIVGHVLTTSDPLMVVDIARDLPPALKVNSGKYLTGSFIAVPIIVDNVPIGVLNVSDKKSGNSFDSFDLRVLSTIATQVGDAYISLKNYLESRSRERLDEEIHIAAELQRKIIPDIPATYAGHALSSCYIPAKMVGGDFYDFFVFDDAKYGILVADVSGKGIPAAMFMGLARNIVRSESRIYSSPAQLLRQSNRYIWEDSEHGMFVTLFYAMVDAHNSLITYGSAGHNNQYLVRSENGDVEKLKASGKPLGIDYDFSYEEKIVLFKPGDRLVLCSDGVIESLDPTVHLDRSEEKFLDELVRYRELSPSDMISAIQGARDFDEYGEHHDDFTLLIIGF